MLIMIPYALDELVAMGAPWLLPGASGLAAGYNVIAGLVLIALTLPRGSQSKGHYGGWDRYIL
jgi:hypothetical protein